MKALNEFLNEENNFKGKTWEDQRDNTLNIYIDTPSNAYIKVDKSQIDSPIKENKQYVIVNGDYFDGNGGEDDCYVIIDKKKEHIVGYDHWNYKILIKLYFK